MYELRTTNLLQIPKRETDTFGVNSIVSANEVSFGTSNPMPWKMQNQLQYLKERPKNGMVIHAIVRSATTQKRDSEDQK